MSEEERIPAETGQLSRREFLKEAGLVVGGATVGSIAIMGACSNDNATATKTVTTTVGGAGSTITITKASETMPEGLLKLNVNGKDYLLTGIKPTYTLAFVLREKCMLPGTKVGCNRGECGSCTVLVDGKNLYSCLVLAVEAAGKKIETVEGLSDGINLSKLQQSFIKYRGFQCCFCTPGYLMSATALLRKNPKPTMAQVQEAVAGNLCPCGNMVRNVKSIMEGGA